MHAIYDDWFLFSTGLCRSLPVHQPVQVGPPDAKLLHGFGLGNVRHSVDSNPFAMSSDLGFFDDNGIEPCRHSGSFRRRNGALRHIALTEYCWDKPSPLGPSGRGGTNVIVRTVHALNIPKRYRKELVGAAAYLLMERHASWIGSCDRPQFRLHLSASAHGHIADIQDIC